MSPCVLDASAILAYLLGEQGEEIVAELLSNPGVICYAHSVNLCEVYYDIIRAKGINIAGEAITSLILDGVIERNDLSRDFWEKVGVLKSRGKISLADCFGIALSQELSCEFVTSDHHELDSFVQLGLVNARFIR